MEEGAWIFLSHSHKDYDKVAEVRNFLEHKGHHPLMFFLKCLNDDHEVDGLIRREIAARSWFVLCNSANAKGSKWVTSEVDIIKTLPTVTQAELDLDDPNLDLDASLFSLTHKATVFLSYARTDATIAEAVRASLRANDFGVFSDWDKGAGDLQTAAETMYAQLDSAATHGAVLFFVTENSIRSLWAREELRAAAEIAKKHGRRVHILVVYVGSSNISEDMDPGLRELLYGTPIADFSGGEFQENMKLLMTTLREYDWQAG